MRPFNQETPADSSTPAADSNQVAGGSSKASICFGGCVVEKSVHPKTNLQILFSANQAK